MSIAVVFSCGQRDLELLESVLGDDSVLWRLGDFRR